MKPEKGEEDVYTGGREDSKSLVCMHLRKTRVGLEMGLREKGGPKDDAQVPAQCH